MTTILTLRYFEGWYSDNMDDSDPSPRASESPNQDQGFFGKPKYILGTMPGKKIWRRRYKMVDIVLLQIGILVGAEFGAYSWFFEFLIKYTLKTSEHEFMKTGLILAINEYNWKLGPRPAFMI